MFYDFCYVPKIQGQEFIDLKINGVKEAIEHHVGMIVQRSEKFMDNKNLKSMWVETGNRTCVCITLRDIYDNVQINEYSTLCT